MSERPKAIGTKQIENDRVIVTEWRFAPGAETGWHRHGHDYIVVPLFDGKNEFDGINAGAGGLEEQVRVHILEAVKHFGFGFTHRWSGYYLYGRALEPARLTHTGI